MVARVGVTVRGGRKLARFLRRAQDPEVTSTAMARAVTRVLRQTVLPRFRADIPVRTGRLRDSIKVEQRGKVVVLTGVYYGRWVKVNGQPLPDALIDYINRHRDLVKRAISAELRKALTEGL